MSVLDEFRLQSRAGNAWADAGWYPVNQYSLDEVLERARALVKRFKRRYRVVRIQTTVIETFEVPQ